MTLGELQGDTLIGRPLDLRLPIQSSPGEQLSEACVRAEIHYGEARQKAPRISLQANQLRLQLSEPVDEPVVKVQVSTFCGGSQIRNYVLLADLPSDFGTRLVASTPSPAVAVQPDRTNAGLAPAAIVLPQRVAVTTARSGLLAPRKTASSAVKNKKTAKKQKTKAATSKRARDRKPASAQTVKRSGGQATKSVLKLDPMEILSDRMDNLELNMPFKPADDAMLQSRQIATLQAELQSTRDLAAKNDASLLAVRSQLQQAQSQLQLTPYLYGLITLLLVGMAGLVWLWRGQKKLTASWWQHASDEDLKTFLQPEFQAQAPKPGALVPLTSPATDRPVANQTGPMAMQKPVAKTIAAARHESGPANIVKPVKINPESVQDIRQQAEFFVSLGQADRAIQILNQFTIATDLPNPLICMDLLGLYQQAGQVPEFDHLREVCHQHFHVQLPDLATFQQDGRSLASYPEILTPLTRLWPGEPVLIFMDNCIFRKDTTKPETRFDLAAFRDLLILHAVAEELALSIAPSGVPANKVAESSKANALKLDFVLPQDVPPANAPGNTAS